MKTIYTQKPKKTITEQNRILFTTCTISTSSHIQIYTINNNVTVKYMYMKTIYTQKPKKQLH